LGAEPLRNEQKASTRRLYPLSPLEITPAAEEQNAFEMR